MGTPFGVTSADAAAPVAVIAPIALPSTAGGEGCAGVEKVRSGPFVVPPALVATTRAW